jgi:predicted alpha/beta-hydrolase family hydrolase
VEPGASGLVADGRPASGRGRYAGRGEVTVRTRRSLPWLLTICLLPHAAARAAEPEVTPLTLSANGRQSSALLMRPADARALLVLGHGANMSMRSPFMASLSEALARQGVATLRFNFPYAEAGASQPDPPPVLQGTVRAAVGEGAKRRGGLPLLLGGKSLGSLVVTHVLKEGLEPVAGAVMLGFPLHQPSRPSARNATGLDQIPVPVLFVQGTRDPLADLPLMRALVEKLGAGARLYVVQGADHQFQLPPDSRRTPEQVNEEIAGAIAAFAATLAPSSGG